MARFDRLVSALIHGQSVRRNDWVSDVQMFVLNGSLMYQYGTVKPWRCALSWDGIAATDWQPLNFVSGARQAAQIAAERPPLLLVEELALPRSFDQITTQFYSQPPSSSSKAS